MKSLNDNEKLLKHILKMVDNKEDNEEIEILINLLTHRIKRLPYGTTFGSKARKD